MRAAMVMVVAAGVLAGCGGDGGDSARSDDELVVAAAFYPMEEVARAVGGEAVEVIGLTPPGTGPHDLELSARSATELERADVVVYLGRDFQPSVEQAVDSLDDGVARVDLLSVAELLPVSAQLEGTVGETDGEVLEGGVDPHVWIDPEYMAALAETLAGTLSGLEPDRSEEFAANAQTYAASMRALNEDFATGLAECRSRTIVTIHRAFEYLARRHNLEQIAIAGITPEAEPDPQSLEAVAEAARAKGVEVIFFESQVPPDLSETVAAEIGARTDWLDPIEAVTEADLDAGVTYESIQRRNLEALVSALGCS